MRADKLRARASTAQRRARYVTDRLLAPAVDPSSKIGGQIERSIWRDDLGKQQDRVYETGYCWLKMFDRRHETELRSHHEPIISVRDLRTLMGSGRYKLGGDPIRISFQPNGILHAEVDDTYTIRPTEWLARLRSTKQTFDNTDNARIGMATRRTACTKCGKTDHSTKQHVVGFKAFSQRPVQAPGPKRRPPNNPTAQAVTVRLREPRFSSKESGTTIFDKTEVLVSEVKAEPGIHSRQLWPAAFKWLASIAIGWGKYRFLDMTIEYVTSQPSTSNGNIYMAYEYGTQQDDGYGTFEAADLLNYEGSVQSTVWTTNPKPSIRYNPRRRQVPWFYVNSEHPGHLVEDAAFLWSYTGSLPPETTIGSFQVRYRIELTQPAVKIPTAITNPGPPPGTNPFAIAFDFLKTNHYDSTIWNGIWNNMRDVITTQGTGMDHTITVSQVAVMIRALYRHFNGELGKDSILMLQPDADTFSALVFQCAIDEINGGPVHMVDNLRKIGNSSDASAAKLQAYWPRGVFDTNDGSGVPTGSRPSIEEMREILKHHDALTDHSEFETHD